jgi:hypothetical protein
MDLRDVNMDQAVVLRLANFYEFKVNHPPGLPSSSLFDVLLARAVRQTGGQRNQAKYQCENVEDHESIIDSTLPGHQELVLSQEPN